MKLLGTDVLDSCFVGNLILARDWGVIGAGAGELGGRGTSVEGWVARVLLEFSGRSALRPLILCLREACVDKAAGTEGLQGLSGGGKGGFPSSESLLECSESEVSSVVLVVAGKEVSTGIEGLHRSSLSKTRVSVKVCRSLVGAITRVEVSTYMC